METISVKDDSGKIYKFEKPEFECELYSVKSFGGSLIIIGAISAFSTWRSNSWWVDGRSTYPGLNNLSPIKPKWYEDIKFPLIFINKKHGGYGVIDNLELFLEDYIGGFDVGEYRVLTKEEVLNLYYEGKGN